MEQLGNSLRKQAHDLFTPNPHSFSPQVGLSELNSYFPIKRLCGQIILEKKNIFFTIRLFDQVTIFKVAAFKPRTFRELQSLPLSLLVPRPGKSGRGQIVGQ